MGGLLGEPPSRRRSYVYFGRKGILKTGPSLEKAIATLSTLPERHPIAEEISEQLGITVRQMAYGRRRGGFRVLFSIQAETVYLHYVRHSARGPIEPGEST